MNKTKHLFLVFCMLLAGQTGAWALETSDDGYYLIDSDQDWVDFTELVKTNPSTNARLTSDITVSQIVGNFSGDFNSSKLFSGIFDGNHHVITANVGMGSTNYVALFSSIRNATIKDLTVTGSVLGGQHCTALVSVADGTNTISNVTISATITATNSHCAAFLGHSYTSVTTISDCYFTGTINGRSSGSTVGVFNGWAHSNGVSIYNCIEMGNYTNCSTFNPIAISGVKSFSNNFYLTPAKNNSNVYGTQLSESIPKGEVYKVFEIMEKTCYIPASVSGIAEKYDFEGEEVKPEPIVNFLGQLLTKDTDYTVTYENNATVGIASVTITGIGDYAGTKVVNFKIVQMNMNGQGTVESPYLIGSDEDWMSFVANISDGKTFSGQFIKLTADVNATEQAGIKSGFPFSGTFDGNGHTLNVDITSTITTDGTNDLGVAPFHYISNATIKNLRVTGTITSYSKHTGGLVGTTSGTNTIKNCIVSVTINTHSSYVGGIVGHGFDSNTTLMDCIFNGTVNGVSITSSYISGLWGWSHGGSPKVVNCLENGTYTNYTLFNPVGQTWSGGVNVVNTYYVNIRTTGSAYGIQATAEGMANGDVATALQNGREEVIWVQDLQTNQPTLKLFAPAEDIPTITENPFACPKENSAAYVTLSGMRLTGQPSQKGIYIINGKKVIVK